MVGSTSVMCAWTMMAFSLGLMIILVMMMVVVTGLPESVGGLMFASCSSSSRFALDFGGKKKTSYYYVSSCVCHCVFLSFFF